jgi:molybdopterin/thiamine biosynthesis adenylyltransferase
MNLQRIASSVDITKLVNKTVTLVGAGASANLACNLARTGIQSMKLVDFDVVSDTNISRQEHHPDQIGRPKVEALADAIHRINPAARVESINRDFLTLTDCEADQLFRQTDLFIFAADKFAVAARGNELALLMNKRAVWIGLYANGQAGEIVFWHRRLDSCLRCLLSNRYEAHARAKDSRQRLDPSSDGCTIFDISLIDAIAGQIVIGQLTQGSPNRYGRIIDELGDRNFIQIQNDSQFAWNGRPLFRDQLQVPPDNDRFYSWNTIARRDPSPQPCPDCERFRGHRFVERDGRWLRIKPGEAVPRHESSHAATVTI